ncbi:MAG TPA: hypothetical protein VGC19_00185 [Rhodanobacter sp.]
MRDILLHCHIFKNSGTAVDVLLQRAFEDQWDSLETKVPRHAVPGQEFVAFAHANPHLRAISSHGAQLPVPRADGISFHPILFLRHPIDRVGSVYAFERRQPIGSSGIGIEVAQQEDLAGYVRWRLAENNGCVIRNFQTLHLAAYEGDLRFAVAGEDEFRRAREILQSLPFLGLVDQFDESIRRLRTYIRPFTRKFSVEDRFPSINASLERAATLGERIAEIEAALGPNLYAELLEHNHFDLALYAEAKQLFYQTVQKEASLHL